MTEREQQQHLRTALSTRQPTSALERVDSWTGLADDALRRRAVAAANSREFDELWDLVESYQTAERGGLASRHTRRSYRAGLRALLEHWQGVNLLRPPARAAENYRLALARRLSPASVNLRLAAARALYRALRWARATEADPFRDLAQVRDPVAPEDKCQPFSFWDPEAGAGETLRRSTRSQAEFERLLDAADHPADRVVILLGAHAGLRRSEMEQLRWRDVDSSAAQVVVRGKGSTLKRVALSDRLLEALAALRSSGETRRRGYVLPWSASRASQRFTALCQRLGIEARGLHALRHTAGTRLYRQSGDLKLVRDHLRHAHLETTKIYAAGDTARARGAVRGW